MKKIRQYTDEYLKYSIGYTQIALSQDYQTFWIIIEIIAQIQRIAMVFLFEEVLHILQDRRNININYVSDQWVCKFISKTFVPTILMADMFSNNSIIAIQIILIVLLCSPLIAIAIFIEYEKSKFATIQFKSQVGGPDNSNLSINLLNRSYNMSNFIENFLYQQLMGNDQRSWLNVVRNFLAKLLNTYPHIFTIPLMYWNLLVVLLVIFDIEISNNQKLFMVVLDTVTTIEMIILWTFSMIAQRSYTMFDNNHLRIQQSTWFNISQVVKFMPIIVQFIYFLYSETQYDNNIQILITSIIQVNLIGDLLDFFISIPYMFEYKQNISFLCLSASLTISLSHQFQLTQMQLFSMCLICIPILTKMIKVIFNYVLQQIFDQQLYMEKKKTKMQKRSSSRRSQFVEDDLQPFVIEKEMQEIKKQQIESLKNQHFRYFVHYLRYISFFRLSDQQSLDKYSKIDNIKKSNFLIKIIVLIKSHVQNCTSVYCYCKGFRGERRQVMDSRKNKVEMKIYNSIQVNNIYLQIELIERYIRHFTKYVFEIENNEKNPNIFRLSQLLLYICDSEECYQVMTFIMDYKQRNIKNTSMLNEVTLTLIIGLVKHKVLQKMKHNLTQDEVEIGIRYKNFRITEIRRDQILNHIFINIDQKIKFIKSLLELKMNFQQLFQSLAQHVRNMTKTQKEIEIFQKYSNCRTSVLLHMFYALEVTCDFDKFVRLRNSLKTKNYKFFEYPSISANTSSVQGFKVLYLKTNLARHSINGKFFRGQIMDFSNNAPYLLGYDPKEFKQTIQTVHQIVTPNLATYHDQLLEIFFLTNKPPIIRKRRPLLMQKKFRELIFCEMYLDLSFNICEDAFPIYCFLKQIVPYGKYENIKGHIVISDTFKIQGISNLALEQLKIKINDYYNKGIEEIIPNFQHYVEQLQHQYQAYQDEEIIREENGSISNKFDYQQQERLLIHFTIEVEQLTFIIPKFDSQSDIYYSNCSISMSIGFIHTKIYQAYLISMKKIALAENQSNSLMFDVFKKGTSQASLNPLRLDSIQGLIDIKSESGDISDLQQIEYTQNEMNNIQEYQLPQIYSNFQTPLDSSRLILTSQRGQNEQLQINVIESHNSLINENEIKSLHKGQTSQKTNTNTNNKKQKQQQQSKYQQEFFEVKVGHQKISEIEVMDEVSGNGLQKIHQTDTHYQLHGNKDSSAIIQKSQLYNKFSKKGNIPKLVKVVLAVDICNLIIILLLSQLFYLLYKSNMTENKEILEVFGPFTTADLIRNTLLGLGHLQNSKNSTLQNETTQLITENINLRFSIFQQVSQKQVVTSTISEAQMKLYDYFQQESQQVSAWTEIFQIWYQMSNFKDFNPQDELYMQKFYKTIHILLNSFFDYIEQYEIITEEFNQKILSNLNDIVSYYQSVISSIALAIEVLVIVCYSIAYMHFFRLKRRILRSSEQIQIQSLEAEKIRLSNLLYLYKNASELNLYKYQFNFKSKLYQENQNLSQFQSLKFTNYTRTDSKKQFKIQEQQYSCLQHPFVFYPLIGIFLCCFYLEYSLITNQTYIEMLSQRLNQFSVYINYCQEVTEICYCDYVVQIQEKLKDINITDQLINTYKDQVQEAYREFLYYDEQFKYGYSDQTLDVLNNLLQNTCSILINPLCTTILNGKLTEGLMYSIQYYSDMVRDDINSEFKQNKKFTRDDLIGINFISQSLENLFIEMRNTLENEIQSQLDDKFSYFILFEIVTVFIYFFQIIFIFRLLSSKFFVCRQLPYLLPPQSIYGEDSFLKSLQYIEKIYNNILQ
ncbi:unnamed protein product [Paramecium pentaurelia]|uniref:Transmembrane protein n=1 Tax=Paramecium pentaurelia TaxID=43138 RepID=A0A8S1X5Y3_9CILI|nr:unnamed protein product [Paramecium pentaurelia]